MLAQKHSADSVVFVDDIAISGPRHISNISGTLLKIIKQEGFMPNKEKTSATGYEDEQVFLGTRVNQGLDVSSKKLREVKAALDFIEDSVCKKRVVDPELLNSVNGKISYIARLNAGAARPLKKRLGAIRQALQPSSMVNEAL